VFLPIGDEPNVRHRPPWANYALILANVVVFVGAQAAARGGAGYDAMVERYAYVPAAPNVLTLFTSMFMHGGLMHLVGNMLYLWIFGDNVETKLGSVGYLAAYLASGVVATAAFGVFNANSAVPLLGASGAISGVQGIYFLLFPRNRVRLLVWFYYVTVVHVKARWIIAFWFVLNDIVVPYVIRGGALGDNVAHAAHLGGFAAGLVVAFAVLPAVRNWFPEEPEGPYGRREPSTLRSSPAWGRGVVGRSGTGTVAGDGPGAAIVSAWRTGRRGDAADAYAERLRRDEPVDLPEPEQIRIAVHLYDGARFDDARRAFSDFLERHPKSANAPAAAFGLGMILSRRDGDFDAALPLLEDAARRHPDPHVREVAGREVARIELLR
jgi:membrane associated rhomboid family serine protease